MTPNITLLVVVGVLFAAGVFLLLERSLTRVLLGVLVLGNATNVLLIASGGPAGDVPIASTEVAEKISDPLPQAMILTAIVITFGIAAFLLAMIHRSWHLARQDDVIDDIEDRRVALRKGDHEDFGDGDDDADDDHPAAEPR